MKKPHKKPLKAIDELRRKFPNDRAVRRFLESHIWKDGRYCHHCGSLKTWPIQGRSARDGLYECGDCFMQFTVTTRTPMHSTKLPLWKWMLVFYFMMNSSKGVSSIFVATWVGVSQKTAWKMCHAVRELMKPDPQADKLEGIVEVDEKYLGGTPRYREGVKNKRGKGTKKQPVFVAVERRGRAVAVPIPNDSRQTLEPLVVRHIHKGAHLVSDESSTYSSIGGRFKSHKTVNHSQKEFSRFGTHANTAESFNAMLERVKFGTYHRISQQHVHRYLDEVAFRWSQRRRTEVFVKGKGKVMRMRPIPVLEQIGAALKLAVGRQLRRTPEGGVKVA